MIHQLPLTTRPKLKPNKHKPQSTEATPSKQNSQPDAIQDSIIIQTTHTTHSECKPGTLTSLKNHGLSLASTTSFQANPSSISHSLNNIYQKDFVTGYISPQEAYDKSKALAQKYPDLVTFVEWEQKTDGYKGDRKDLQGGSPLYYLKITAPQDSSQDKKLGVFHYASPHAREWMNPMIMLETAEQLLANYQPDSTDSEQQKIVSLLQSLNIYIAPQTNPDGANYSFYDNNMWRKNQRDNKDGTFGVDINRNYPYDWKASSNTRGQTYSGPAPASEKETQHILKIVEDNPDIKFVVDWHSYSEEIRRPKGVSSQDTKIYDRLHDRMQKAIASYRGRNYDTVVSQVTDGTSDDHFYHENGIISTVMETGREFQPSIKEALSVKNECTLAALEVLEFAMEQTNL